MKYIVWTTIPCEGAAGYECDSWQEVLDHIKKLMEDPCYKNKKRLQAEYRKWLAGERADILAEVPLGPGYGRQTYTFEMFVTTDRLNKPVQEIQS